MPSWSSLCGGRAPVVSYAISWSALTRPLLPGGRTSWKPPESPAPWAGGIGGAAEATAGTAVVTASTSASANRRRRGEPSLWLRASRWILMSPDRLTDLRRRPPRRRLRPFAVAFATAAVLLAIVIALGFHQTPSPARAASTAHAVHGAKKKKRV